MVLTDPLPTPMPETVFLVSGGAKGITAACVIALAKRFHSRFILVGRSHFDGSVDPTWAQGLSDDAALMQAAMAALKADGEEPNPRRLQKMVRDVQSQREIQETLDAVTAGGGLAIYAQADVTDAAGLRAAVAEAAAKLGPITGVVHGAGVLADKLVKDQALADFERVVSVKVDGLRNLLTSVPLDQLSFLVLFSSVAGFYGNVGQAGYAVANEILNKVAHWARRQAPHCRVLAVDWGPWDGGMVTPALRRQLEARDIDVIPVDAGTALLADLVEGRDIGTRAAATQVVVGKAIRPLPSAVAGNGSSGARRIRRKLSVAANPFLRDHVIGGNAVLPTVCAVSWMVNACEQLVPGYRYLRVDDYRALKGIVFDDGLADHYVLELKPQPLEASDAGGRPDRVAIDALILSEAAGTPHRSAGGLPRYHYRTTVTLAADIAADRRAVDAMPNQAPVLAPQRFAGNMSIYGGAAFADAGGVVDGAQLYGTDGSTSQRVLFHGPSFQGIDAILSMDEGGLTMRSCLPPLFWETQGQFPVQSFNPYVVDVQLQSLLVWSYYHLGYGGLPLRIGWGLQLRPLSFGAVTYTQMKVRTCTARSLVADVGIYDASGKLCMEVGEAEITLSERLNALFAQNQLPDSENVYHVDASAPCRLTLSGTEDRAVETQPEISQ
ncbi:MAG: SDR family NAD(P)-dependent oxidoreductase [Anaerolineae bacterium]|nr:SDR family NAD(P)-dependent oxidoreductase [Anaerolineae bacterium]